MRLTDPTVRLREAIIAGNLLIVKRLLRRFPELLTNIDPSNGWSSLHYAAFYGRYLICVHLIQLGHDKHEVIKTFKGNTCVHLALMNGHEQTTHLLLQHFPSFINQRGENGKTPVHIACIHDYNQCLSLLMGVGAELTLSDENGETPLHLCLEYGSYHCLRMLLTYDTSIKDEDQLKDNYDWKPSDVPETFEFGKIYKKLQKELNQKDSPKKPSFPNFKTPILDSKTLYDPSRSPPLMTNSSYTSYSTTLTPFTKSSRSRKTSSVTPVAAIPAFTSRATRTSSLVDSNSSISLKTQNSENNNTPNTADVSQFEERKPLDQQQKQLSRTFIKYMPHSDGNEDEIKFVSATDNKDSLINIATSPIEKRRTSRKLSLLNIPISRLRHDNNS
ncbi:hypothetical protein KAFR_0A00280 [Kazachstania africana CBS 2517]|uniref:Uncharacterized protein n=1 Tax=Kazachstania africana (strain ATCC 22294 / BCRC 22015 / CBS 2517 / CECT 1963 / NBRC 1671 / NRRL Y-8276) TaxID=1071382 RepID=H2AM66_KAZAF|nr:hypothetical protein KAFR_0A00280 [Kazachstania africana CBS 2517]CCF55466.1 hypothetical protein KAFR_0A00280 [Kazachstania africana CBS 2517]